MCTLIAFHRVASGGLDPAAGTLVAANRDELYARPARPPERIAPQVVAGVDASQGGTWLGVHASGLFVGLTNQRSFGARDGTKKTRGEVVTDALRGGDLVSAVAYLEQLSASEYNGFNLLLGDGERLMVAYARPEVDRVALHELGPGVHVLGNDRLRSPDFPKAARIEGDAREHLAQHGDLPFEARVASLRALLGSHAQPELSHVHVPADQPFPRELVQALEATCIHTPQYGTVSSTLLNLAPQRPPTYWFADGAPCQTAFQPVSVSELLIG